MREILFRGKSIESGKFIYGDLFHDKNVFGNIEASYIYEFDDAHGRCFQMEVIPETVGEYTVLKDKNGEKIFEGDILNGFRYPYLSDEKHNYIAEVVFFDDPPAFGLLTRLARNASVRGISDGNCDFMSGWEPCQWEVIGNIHENPELLQEDV